MKKQSQMIRTSLEMKMTNNTGDESGSQDTAVILRSQDTQ